MNTPRRHPEGASDLRGPSSAAGRSSAVSTPLFQVRDLLRRRGMATSAQLAAELRLPSGVVDDMLAHWGRRGMVAEVGASASGHCASGGSRGCSSCGQCAAASTPATLYHWRDPDSRTGSPVTTLRLIPV